MSVLKFQLYTLDITLRIKELLSSFFQLNEQRAHDELIAVAHFDVIM